MTRSHLEEEGTNLHGISCVHVQGQDELIPPLQSSNLTEIKDKINEMIEEMGKNAQFRTNADSRLNKMENRIDNKLNSVAVAALHSDKSENVVVKNSVLLEGVLVIVCICFTIFMTIRTFDYVRKNFLGQPRRMRSSSEHTLAMNVDYE